MMNKCKPMLASYARSFLAASLAVVMAGVTDPKAIFAAGAAAVLPVFIRWLNPNDALGKGK